MAKHDADPVLGQLVHAVNESGQTRVPVTVSAHGTVLTGVLIAQDVSFTQVGEGSPLLSALQLASGLLGQEYAKEVSAEADHICTSALLDPGRDCGGSAWRRWTAGHWTPPGRKRTTTVGRSSGCSAHEQ
jgi:hypothetical protein